MVAIRAWGAECLAECLYRVRNFLFPVPEHRQTLENVRR